MYQNIQGHLQYIYIWRRLGVSSESRVPHRKHYSVIYVLYSFQISSSGIYGFFKKIDSSDQQDQPSTKAPTRSQVPAMITTTTMMVSVSLLLFVIITTTEAFLPLLPSNGVGSRTTARALFAEYQSKIDSCNSILIQAATTKNEDPDLVYEALSDLEKLMREKCKAEPEASQQVLQNLNGSWRLVFSTFNSFRFIVTVSVVPVG